MPRDGTSEDDEWVIPTVSPSVYDADLAETGQGEKWQRISWGECEMPASPEINVTPFESISK